MVWLFDHGKEREEITHGGIGEMFPQKPAQTRTFERAHAGKTQSATLPVDPDDLRFRNQHCLRKFEDQGQSLSYGEALFALQTAAGVGEIQQEGLSCPAGTVAFGKLQAPGYHNAIGLPLNGS